MKKSREKKKEAMFEEMITPNFPETMEEEVFTDTWPTAYLEEKKKKGKMYKPKENAPEDTVVQLEDKDKE